MDSLPLRREVIDTLMRHLAVPNNKWSRLLSELSQICDGSDAKQACRHLLEQCSSVIRISTSESTKESDAFTQQDIDKLSVYLSRLRELSKDAVADASPLGPNELRLFIADLVGNVEGDRPLFSALLKNLVTSPTGLTTSSAETAADTTAILVDDLVVNFEEIVFKTQENESLSTNLMLMKLLVLLIVRQNSAATSAASGPTISNNSTSIERLKASSQSKLSGREELEECLRLVRERERLSTFDCAPRLLLLSGRPGKLSSLEVQGNATGLIGGVKIPADSGHYYYEVTIKGPQTNASGVRIGWGIAGGTWVRGTGVGTVVGDHGSSNKVTPLLPGDTDDSWTFDGSISEGVLYHNAYSVAAQRREEEEVRKAEQQQQLEAAALIRKQLADEEQAEATAKPSSSDVKKSGGDDGGANEDVKEVLESAVAFVESSARAIVTSNATTAATTNATNADATTAGAATADGAGAGADAKIEGDVLLEDDKKQPPGAVDNPSTPLPTTQSTSGELKRRRRSEDSKKADSSSTPSSKGSSPPPVPEIKQGHDAHFKAFSKMMRIGLDFNAIRAMLMSEGVSSDEIDDFIAIEKSSSSSSGSVGKGASHKRSSSQQAAMLKVAFEQALAAGAVSLSGGEMAAAAAVSSVSAIGGSGSKDDSSLSSSKDPSSSARVLTPKYNWSNGTVVGCLLDTNTGDMTFYVNGCRVKSVLAVSMAEKLKQLVELRGAPSAAGDAVSVSPAFVCSESVGLEFNIGQAPFRYQPVVAPPEKKAVAVVVDEPYVSALEAAVTATAAAAAADATATADTTEGATKSAEKSESTASAEVVAEAAAVATASAESSSAAVASAEAQASLAAVTTSTTSTIGVGSRIDCNYKNRGKYYPGTVIKERGDGSFDLEYDDGDFEKKVPLRLLRVREHESSSPPESKPTSPPASKPSSPADSKKRKKKVVVPPPPVPTPAQSQDIPLDSFKTVLSSAVSPYLRLGAAVADDASVSETAAGAMPVTVAGSSRIQINDVCFDPLNGLTVEASVRLVPKTTDDNHTAISNVNTVDQQQQQQQPFPLFSFSLSKKQATIVTLFAMHDGSLSLFIDGVTDPVLSTSPSVFERSVWRHIALTVSAYDGSSGSGSGSSSAATDTITLYVDGMARASGKYSCRSDDASHRQQHLADSSILRRMCVGDKLLRTATGAAATTTSTSTGTELASGASPSKPSSAINNSAESNDTAAATATSAEPASATTTDAATIDIAPANATIDTAANTASTSSAAIGATETVEHIDNGKPHASTATPATTAALAVVMDICELRVWTVTRRAEDILGSLGRSKITGVEPTLVACYAFEETSGPQLLDSTLFKGGARRKGATALIGSYRWMSHPVDRTAEARASVAAFSRGGKGRVSSPAKDEVNTIIDEWVSPSIASSRVVESILLGMSRRLLCTAVTYEAAAVETSDGPGSIRKLQRRFFGNEIQTVCRPTAINFRLIASLLKQLLQISLIDIDNEGAGFLSVALLTTLHLLRVNLEERKELDLKVDAVGLSWPANHPLRAGEHELCTVRMLLTSVFKVLSGDDSFICALPESQRSVLRSQASSVFISNIEVFLPSACDHVLLLETLLIKKQLRGNSDSKAAYVSSSAADDDDKFSKTVVSLATKITTGAAADTAAATDITATAKNSLLAAVVDISEAGDDIILKALLTYYSKPSRTRVIIPFALRQTGNSEPKANPLLDTYYGDAIVPLVGDFVKRGPDWGYGDQDGTEGVLGYVIEIVDWLGEAQRGVVVQWPNGSVNTYRWGVTVPVPATPVENLPQVLTAATADSSAASAATGTTSDAGGKDGSNENLPSSSSGSEETKSAVDTEEKKEEKEEEEVQKLTPPPVLPLQQEQDKETVRKVYDVAVQRPRECYPFPWTSTSPSLSASSASASASASEKSTDKKEAKRLVLPFTADELKIALMDGLSTLPFDQILQFLQATAPAAWLESKNLVAPIEELNSIESFCEEEALDLFTSFHDSFSVPRLRPILLQSELVALESEKGKKEGQEEEDTVGVSVASRFPRFFEALVRHIERATIANKTLTSSEKSDEDPSLALGLLAALQACMTGFGHTAPKTPATASNSANLLRALNGSVTVQTVTTPAAEACVVRKPFAGFNRNLVKWNFVDGSWVNMTADDIEALSSADGKDAGKGSDSTYGRDKEVRILRDLAFDPGYVADHVMLSKNDRRIQQSRNRVWSSAIGTIPLSPNSGVYRWYVSLESTSPKRIHCMLGVATGDFNSDFFLGQDEDSWGLTTSRDLFHNGRKLRSDYGHKLSKGGTTIEITLDTDNGTLAIEDLDELGDDPGIAFDGLKGLTLFPAFSLYSSDDRITILNNFAESDAHLKAKKRKSASAAAATSRSAHTLPTEVFKAAPRGVPPPAVVKLVQILANSAGNLLESSEENVLHPLISVHFQQLLSTLTRWQSISRYDAKAVYQSLNSLLQKLRVAISKARFQFNYEVLPASSLSSILPAPIQTSTQAHTQTRIALNQSTTEETKETVSVKDNSQSAADTAAARHTTVLQLLVQTSCIVSSYLGLLTSVWIDGSSCVNGDQQVSNRILAAEETAAAAEFADSKEFAFVNTFAASSSKYTGSTSSMQSPCEWVRSKLFSRGIIGSTTKFLAELIEGRDSGAASLLVSWVSSHDTTHLNFKRMGGEAMNKPVRMLFGATLLHGGYLRFATAIANKLFEIASSGDSQPMSIASILQLKPPFFLTVAWENAMTLRTAARNFAMSVTTSPGSTEVWGSITDRVTAALPSVAELFSSRIQLLLELEQSRPDAVIDHISHEIPALVDMFAKDFGSQHQTSQSADLRATAKQVSAFVMDTANTLPKIRAVIAAVEERAVLRKEGLKAFRAILGNLAEDFGWAAKCAMLLHFPYSLRRCQLLPVSSTGSSSTSSSGSVSSSTVDGEYNGHYFSSLDGCSRSEKLEIRGAFDSLFAYLTEELSSSSCDGGAALQLNLLDCLGVRIIEDDHVLLARVNIFYILQELLDAALTDSTDKSACASLGSSSRLIRRTDSGRFVSAADDGPVALSNVDFSAQSARKVTQAAMKLFILLALQVASTGEREMSYLSSRLSAPTLRKARSGPGTLNTAVFDILYAQLANVTNQLRISIGGELNAVEAAAELKTPSKDDGDSSTSPLTAADLPRGAVKMSSDASIILNEGMILLACVSQDTSCQRLLSKPRWMALLLELALIGPTVCRQRAIVLLADLLPLLEPSVFLQSDQELINCLSAHLGSTVERDTVAKSFLKLILRQCSGVPSADNVCVLMQSERRTPGADASAEEAIQVTDIPTAYALSTVPVASEAVALVRFLLLSPQWNSVIERVLGDILKGVYGPSQQSSSDDTVNKELLREVIGSVAVLGGHVDAPYAEGPAIVEGIGGRDSDLAIISSLLEGQDIAEIITSSSSTIDASLLSASSSSSSVGGRTTTMVSLDKVKAINRCPLEGLKISKDLIGALLCVFDEVVLEGNSDFLIESFPSAEAPSTASASAAAPVVAEEKSEQSAITETKTEGELKEEKESGAVTISSSTEPKPTLSVKVSRTMETGIETLSDLLVQQSSRSLSSLIANPAAADIIIELLTSQQQQDERLFLRPSSSTSSSSSFVVRLLQSATRLAGCAGLSDLVTLEGSLFSLLAKRRKVSMKEFLGDIEKKNAKIKEEAKKKAAAVAAAAAAKDSINMAFAASAMAATASVAASAAAASVSVTTVALPSTPGTPDIATNIATNTSSSTSPVAVATEAAATTSKNTEEAEADAEHARRELARDLASSPCSSSSSSSSSEESSSAQSMISAVTLGSSTAGIVPESRRSILRSSGSPPDSISQPEDTDSTTMIPGPNTAAEAARQQSYVFSTPPAAEAAAAGSAISDFQPEPHDDDDEDHDHDSEEEDEGEERGEGEDGDQEEEQDQGEEQMENDVLDMMVSMGFERRVSDMALELCGGDLDEAVNYILSNGEALEQMVASRERRRLRDQSSSTAGAATATTRAAAAPVSGADGESHVSTPRPSQEADDSKTTAAASATGAREQPTLFSDLLIGATTGGRGGGDDADAVGSDEGDRLLPITRESSSATTNPGEGEEEDYESPSMDAPRTYFYPGENGRVMPLHAEPNASSERLGAVFPGDEVWAYGISNLTGKPEDVWLKTRMAEFEDEAAEDFDGSNSIEDLFVWVQQYRGGKEVIISGSSNGIQPALAHSPGDAIPVRATYQVVGSNGAVVRDGVETSSRELTALHTGDIVQAVEETYNSEGILRLRIVRPVCGWISKLIGLVSKIADAKLESNGVCGGGDGGAGASEESKICSSSQQNRAVTLSEIELLERIDDDMEHWGDGEVYRKDDRLFGTLQGTQYQRRREVGKRPGDSSSRRLRQSSIAPAFSYAGVYSSLNSITGAQLERQIGDTIHDKLVVLYSRRVMLALLIRGLHPNSATASTTPLVTTLIAATREACSSSPAVSAVTPITPVSTSDETKTKETDEVPPPLLLPPRPPPSLVAQEKSSTAVQSEKSAIAILPVLQAEKQASLVDVKGLSSLITSLLRLSTFRGAPYSISGLEVLAFDDITAAGVPRNSLTTDAILGPLVASVIQKKSPFVKIGLPSDEVSAAAGAVSPETAESFREQLISALTAAIAQNLRLSTSLSSQSLADSSYEDMTDDDILKTPHLHFAVWASDILLQTNRLTDVIPIVFHMWSLLLRAASMSVKHAAFLMLSKMLISMKEAILLGDTARASDADENDLSVENNLSVLTVRRQMSSTMSPAQLRIIAMKSCLDGLPIDRLRAMASKRLWFEMEDDPAYSRYLQAMLQLLSDIDECVALAVLRDREAAAAQLVVSSFDSPCLSRATTEGQVPIPSTPGVVTEAATLGALMAKVEAEDAQDLPDVSSDTNTKFGERPVIDFTSSSSHVLLSPQRDMQGPWTVELWVYRQECAPTEATSADRLETDRFADENEDVDTRSRLRDRGFLSVETSASRKALQVLGISPASPAPRTPGVFGISSLRSFAAGVPTPDQPHLRVGGAGGGGGGILGARTGLAALLSLSPPLSDFGMGAEDSRGLLRPRTAHRAAASGDDSSSWGTPSAEAAAIAGMDDAVDSAFAADWGELEDGDMSSTPWAVVPPPTFTSEGSGGEGQGQRSRFSASISSSLMNRVRRTAIGTTSSAVTAAADAIRDPFAADLAGDDDPASDLSRSVLSDAVAELERISARRADALRAQSDQPPAPPARTSNESIRQRFLDLLREREEAVQSTVPGRSQSSQDTPSARLGSNAVAAEGAAAAGEGPVKSQKSGKENNSTTSGTVAENKETSTAVFIQPTYLLQSLGGHIKLQMGGRLFAEGDVPDSVQAANPVHQQALCLSIGQKGSADRAFDFVVPTGRWVHIAIACTPSTSTGVSGASPGSVTLYVDGDLRDTLAAKFSLPIGTLGSSRKGQSFYGSVAEMRVWSTARSQVEIRRDMLSDVTGSKGLLAHLKCAEGRGVRTFDFARLFNTCKLTACSWVTTVGPVMRLRDVPSFMLSESEEVEGLFGEKIGSSAGVIEMTGVLRRSPCRGSVDALALEASEVVCLCYRPKHVAPVTEGGDATDIEGYLDWCERGVRSRLSGSISSSGDFKFTIGSGSTILGIPDTLEWIQELQFTGSLVEGRVKGSFSISALVPPAPLLGPGDVRLDKFGISREVLLKSYSRDKDRSKVKGREKSCDIFETLTVSENAVEEQYIITVEVAPFISTAAHRERSLASLMLPVIPAPTPPEPAEPAAPAVSEAAAAEEEKEEKGEEEEEEKGDKKGEEKGDEKGGEKEEEKGEAKQETTAAESKDQDQEPPSDSSPVATGSDGDNNSGDNDSSSTSPSVDSPPAASQEVATSSDTTTAADATTAAAASTASTAATAASELATSEPSMAADTTTTAADNNNGSKSTTDDDSKSGSNSAEPAEAAQRQQSEASSDAGDVMPSTNMLALKSSASQPFVDASDGATADDSVEEKQKEKDIERFGMCTGSGSIWVEWLVQENCGMISFGATAVGTILDPDSSMFSNPETWCYLACGQVAHGNDFFDFDPLEEGDILGLQIDSNRGTLTFYRNDNVMIEFENLNEHPALRRLDSNDEVVLSSEQMESKRKLLAESTVLAGIRPFLCLSAGNDSSSFIGAKSGRAKVIFSETDAADRLSFTGQISEGSFNGVGQLRRRRNGESVYWYGHWIDGKQHGPQLRILVQEDGTEVLDEAAELFDRGAYIRDLTPHELKTTPLVAKWQAALKGGKVEEAEAKSSSSSSKKAPKDDKTKSKTSADGKSSDSITFRLRDHLGAELHFKVSANIKMQKVFDVYASKRDLNVTSLRFLYEGTRIAGDCTPEKLGIEESETIDVIPDSLSLSVISASATDILLEKYFTASTAPLILQIILTNGATVRSGVEIEDSMAIRMLQCSDVIEAFARSKTREGIPRFQLSDGWISEKLRGGNEERVVRILRELLLSPQRYTVVRTGGAKLRASPGLTSEDKGMIPEGTIITVAEKRTEISQSQSEGDTVRMRIVDPPEYAGWVSEKQHIVDFLDELPRPSLSSSNSASDKLVPVVSHDPEVAAELARRASVRLHRATLKKSASSAKKRFALLSGSLDVSSETFFLLNGSNKSSSLAITQEFTTVSYEGPSAGRGLSLGSRGFTRGVHYWEVQVDTATWGGVFIGVAPAEASGWTGYGILNYRATQVSGSETLYGSYFAAGDTVGVLLDLDHGTISFFKDGEDFNLGRVVAINMGVAYHNLRRNNRSPTAALYPCLGLKSSGDQLSIRKCRWASCKGLGPNALLRRALQAKHIISSWRDSYIMPPMSIPTPLIHEMFRGYIRWRAHNKVKVKSRPGLEVEIDKHLEAIQKAAGSLSDTFGLRPGKRVRTRYGEGRIIGARQSQIWYTLDSGETGAWYWTREELMDLVSCQFVNFDLEDDDDLDALVDVELDTAAPLSPGGGGVDNIMSSPQRSGAVTASGDPKLLSFEEFSDCLTTSSASWTIEDDEALSKLVNSIADKDGIDPLSIPAIKLEKMRRARRVLPKRTSQEVQARYAALCVLNKAASIALPLSDFGRLDSRVPLINTTIDRFASVMSLISSTKTTSTTTAAGGQNKRRSSLSLNTVTATAAAATALDTLGMTPSGKTILDIKRAIFTRTKMGLWNLAVYETTTPTGAPPDEYERPDDLREISINRIEARNLSAVSLVDASRDSVPFPDRLRISVFGQLLQGIRGWDERSLRRSFVHMQDAGQARAFFVKFAGEGVDDHGGPYRAAFQTAVGEEPTGILGLLVPSNNANAETGNNRDQMVLNQELLSNPERMSLYTHFGRLIALACRHSIMVPLPLPQLIWKPLAGEAIGANELQATDLHLLNRMREISDRVSVLSLSSHKSTAGTDTETEGETEQADGLSREEIAELLVQGLLNCPSLAATAAAGHETAAAVSARMFVLGASAATNSSSSGATCSSSPLASAAGTATAAVHSDDPSSIISCDPERLKAISELILQNHLTAHNAGLTHIYNGLSAILPAELFPIFTAAELEALFCGYPDVDLEVLKKATVYEGVSANDKHIKIFWEALEQMSQDERSQFINFCSGRSRLPASASDFPMSFKLIAPPPRSRESPDNYLPVAQTCFFSLSLPEYSSVEVCKEKLKYSISNTELMDADFAMRTAQGWENVR